MSRVWMGEPTQASRGGNLFFNTDFPTITMQLHGDMVRMPWWIEADQNEAGWYVIETNCLEYKDSLWQCMQRSQSTVRYIPAGSGPQVLVDGSPNRVAFVVMQDAGGD